MNYFIDDRGRSIFDVFPDLPGQINVSVIEPGAVKAFHRHQKQEDWVTCLKGALKLVLYDNVNGLNIHVLSEYKPAMIRIPVNTWHGYQALGGEPGTILYYCTQKFDGKDEERCDWDEFYDWKIENK